MSQSILDILNKWDPIGVKQDVGARYEYDGYVMSVYTLLTSKPSEEQIREHLFGVILKNMGMESIESEVGRKERESAAHKLFDLSKNI